MPRPTKFFAAMRELVQTMLSLAGATKKPKPRGSDGRFIDQGSTVN